MTSIKRAVETTLLFVQAESTISVEKLKTDTNIKQPPTWLLHSESKLFKELLSFFPLHRDVILHKLYFPFKDCKREVKKEKERDKWIQRKARSAFNFHDWKTKRSGPAHLSSFLFLLSQEKCGFGVKLIFREPQAKNMVFRGIFMLLKGEVMSNMESYIKILRQQCDIVSQPPMHVRYDPIYPQLKKINMLSSFFLPGETVKEK